MASAEVCPVPREALLAMVREEREVRLSKEFQTRLERADRKAGDERSGIAAEIERMQVGRG